MKLEHLFARQDEYTIVVDITPEIADDWIKHCNTRNRRCAYRYVMHLAEEIDAGRWKLTHQGIAFSRDRILLDGQHRLLAIVLAGKTVPVRVTFNMSPETMDAIDIGRMRTNDEIISLTGDMGKIESKELAVMRAMLSGAYAANIRRSPAEERELLKRHIEAVRFAISALPKSAYRGVANSITRAVLARAWYSQDREKVANFGRALQAGIPTSTNDQPAMLLIQLLTRLPGSNASAIRREKYQKTERALAAFLTGETLGRLHAAAEELFPLPEENQNAIA